LQQARRHVVEGEERIVKQRALVAELIADQQKRMAGHARALLAALITAQTVSKKHLADLEHRADLGL